MSLEQDFFHNPQKSPSNFSQYNSNITYSSPSTVAPPGKIGICEKDGRLCTIPIREGLGNSFLLENYPEINIPEVFNSPSIRSTDSYRHVLIEVNENILKKISRIYFESGFKEALDEACSVQTAASHPFIHKMAVYLQQTLIMYRKLKLKLMPYLEESGNEALEKYSETRDWISSYIKYIAWHPNYFKIAVANADDIRIYTDEFEAISILKNINQKCILSMAWRPYTANELAVGCQKGICLWTADKSLHIARRISQVILLTHPNHCPVTSVQWSSEGSYLASASISDPDILIWDVDLQENEVLKRVSSGYSLLKWSPDMSYLFSASTGNVFRVWKTEENWEPERWLITKGYIQSAVWSPCSRFLLFVTSEESILYKLQFIEEQLFANSSLPKVALPVADLSKITVETREIGGLPQALAWDPNGNYLAVIFKNSSSVAIFSTSIRRQNLNISPSCYLTGIGTEYPCVICFQNKIKADVSCVLTIAWSSGRVQYFPFINI